MDITDFYTANHDVISFSEQQASEFAKGVAGDFNPIHDPGSKRFCVPGDLLFAVMLHRFGVATKFDVQFAGMLTDDSSVQLPPTVQETLSVKDNRDRDVLSLSLSGTRYNNPQLISGITTAYVRFSGKTFPDILVPLMRDANAMINPQRPLVIYKNMSLNLFEEAAEINTDNIDQNLDLTLDDASLIADGRKGAVSLDFNIHASGQQIGKGNKNMVLSGLREFDDAAMQGIIDEYNDRRSRYGK